MFVCVCVCVCVCVLIYVCVHNHDEDVVLKPFFICKLFLVQKCLGISQ